MKDEKQLLSVGFILSIFLLLLNDFYLKAEFSGVVTGKLSDFVGLFALPFFVSVLFPSKKKWIYVITGLGFVVWKLPIADNFITLWNQYLFYSINRVVDYTDYVALLVLPISYYYQPNKMWTFNIYIKKAAVFSVVSLAVFSFLATAGTHGKIKGYELSYSKREVSYGIRTFFYKHPEYKVPEEFESYTWHYRGTPPNEPSEDDWTNRASADSINFDFYFKEYNMIMWTKFSQHEDNWNGNSCDLGLISTIVPGEKGKLGKDLTDEEKEKVTSYFEEEILSKLEQILEGQLLIE